MKFKDIPQLTSIGSYQVNMELKYAFSKIKEWIEDDFYKLQLNPDFQRGNVWKESQQIKYIEYLLKGGKSARVIYFNMPSWQSQSIKKGYNDFVVVDGLQRLTAVMKFINNELKVFGYYFKEFEDRLPRDVDLLFNVNNLKTKQEVLQWYLDMNSGGTVHSQDELDKVRKMIGE